MHQLTARSIQISTAGSLESNADHIHSCLARGLPEFVPTPCFHDGTIVIVGSGPSLPEMKEEIAVQRALGRPLLAVNGAHDFLMENDLIPDLFLTVDPRTSILGNIKHKNKETVYLLASRVHPEVFDHLADCKVTVWHSWSSESNSPPPNVDGRPLHWNDFNPLPECEIWHKAGRLGIGGGSTSGLRAMNVAYLMGFRKIIMFGMDSCLAEDRYTKRFSGENIGDAKKNLTDVIVGGKRFFCNWALAAQASEFQEAIAQFKDLKIEICGGGLLSAIMEAREKRGYKR